MEKVAYILIILVVFAACNRGNKLNTNEQKLANDIKAEEQQKRDAEEELKQRLAAIPDTLPPGFHFNLKEDRSVDPDYPPIVIDFTKEAPIRRMKLSDIADKITYIRLKVPNDSLYLSPHMGRNISFTTDNIILNNNFGIHRFSRTGEYIEPIANSNVQNRKSSRKFLFGYFNKETYRGVWTNHVSTAGNRIFYKYSDYPNEKVSLFQYELKPGEQTISFSGVKENSNDISFTKGEFVTSGKEAYRSGTQGLASTKIEAVSSNCYAGFSNGLKAYDNGLMLVTFKLNGDTLCKFTQFDTLDTPITSSLIRSISTISSWHYKGVYSFKRAFNDTIFRLIPPNRLVPAFVLNFGEHKITDEDWYHFHKSLNGKIKPGAIYETEKFLLLEYSIYSQTSKRFDVQVFALFDKTQKKLYQLDFKNRINNNLYVNTEQRNGFENDIDGGFPFWPHYVTPDGYLAKSLQPESLKSLVNNDNFENRNGNKEHLKAFVKTLTNNTREIVIMIIE